ncbi:MAG: hypothetical protein RR808_04415 [Akkermansia sp.]
MNRITLFLSISALGVSFSQAATTVAKIDFGSKATTVGSTNISVDDAIAATQRDLVGMSGKVSLSSSTTLIKGAGAGRNVKEINSTGWNGSSNTGWWDPIKTTPSGHSYADSEKDGIATANGANGIAPDLIITFTGLEAGNYSMEVLSGFFSENYIASNLTFTFSGAGLDTTGTDWTSSVINNSDSGWQASNTATGTSSLTTGTVYPTSPTPKDQGALVNADNIVVGSNGTLILTITSDAHGGNTPVNMINNIILTKTDKSVPEASTATLSLLALAGLMLRRRRN